MEQLKELCGSIFYDVNYQKDFDADSLVDSIMNNIINDFDKLVIDSEFKFYKTSLHNMILFGVINFHNMFRSNKFNDTINTQLIKIINTHFQHPDISIRSISSKIYDFPKSKYLPQPYIQKLIYSNILVFDKIDSLPDNSKDRVIYSVNENYFLTLDKEGFDYPIPISDIVEHYSLEKFESFEVYSYADEIFENILDLENNITCYKKLSI